MNSLILSRRDIEFLLYDWLGVLQLTTLDRFQEHNRETFGAALDVYEKIAKEHFEPHNRESDKLEPHFDGTTITICQKVGLALNAFCKAGLMAAGHDYELGGMQLPCVIEKAGFAFLNAANIATAAYPFLTIGNANLLLQYATPDLIQRYVQPELEGRFFGTMCLSEPQAGSSLGDIRTKALKSPDDTYRLFGTKMWISGGDHDLSQNIVHLVLAKCVDEKGDIPSGVKSISLFLVPKIIVNQDGSAGERNDVVLAGLNHKMGYRGTINTVLNFGEGVHRPQGESGAIGYLIGDVGKGLSYMFHMMNEARIGVGLGAAALGYTGYLHSLDYARNRPQGRLPESKDPSTAQVYISEHPDVKRMLLTQKAYVEGAIALLLFCAQQVDLSQESPSESTRDRAHMLLDLLTPIAKSWPSQWCLEANNLAIQVLGGSGYTRDYMVEQFYRDNRLNMIHEGTHGIQALDLLGRKITQYDGKSMAILDSLIQKTIQKANDSGSSQLNLFASDLIDAWRLLTAVSSKLTNKEMRTRGLANATPYMESFGHILIAWISLDIATTAQKLLESATGSSTFFEGKLASCQYFFEWELPLSIKQLQIIERNPDTFLVDSTFL